MIELIWWIAAGTVVGLVAVVVAAMVSGRRPKRREGSLWDLWGGGE